MVWQTISVGNGGIGHIACWLACCAFVVLMMTGGCANRGVLTGGVADTTQPLITRTTPAQFATNVTGNTVTIAFATYVQREILQGIAIQPDVRFVTHYAGNEIEIEFVEPLRDSTTYVLTLGTSWKSHRGVQPAQAQTVVFSTGSSVASGVIEGLVETPSSADIWVMVFDSLPLGKPVYRQPLGANKQFRFSAMPNGTFWVAATRETTLNQSIDANEQRSIPWRSITTEQSVVAYTHLWMNTPPDSIPPTVVRCNAPYSTRCELSMSEPVLIHQSSVTILDSLGTPYGGIAFAKRLPTTTVSIQCVAELTAGTYTIVAPEAWCTDTAGNRISVTKQELVLRRQPQSDTTTFVATYPFGKDSTATVAFDTLEIRFSEPVDTVGFSTVTFQGQPLRRQFDSPTLLRIFPPEAQQRVGVVNVPMENLRSVSGKPLSNPSTQIRTKAAARMTVGSITGMVVDSTTELYSSKHKLIVQAVRDGNVLGQTVVGPDNRFTLTNIQQGETGFRIVVDTNNNLMYDSGELQPFVLSEPWFLAKQRAVVRANWTIEGVTLGMQQR
jgi:hypothetical protein